MIQEKSKTWKDN